MGRTRRAVLGFSMTAAALAVGIAGAPEATAAGQPADTPARTGVPGNIVAIGDSITTATGTGNLGAEVPQNSWVTGTNGSINSMRQRLGISSANAYNQASNGRRMEHFDDQVNAIPAGVTPQYLVVELGGNDLCKDTVAEMTSVADYRAQFRAGLQAVATRAPNALVFVASIPDIYNLWYLRGAPSSVNPYVADETGQDEYAHLYWGTLGVIPCQSLLADPTDTSPEAEARRQAVRTRNLAFNQVLAEECGAVLRCRYDGNAFFNRTSNRVTPPNGPYLPRNQWFFDDGDISYNTGTFSFLCPAPGVLSGGTICGDMFHPSLQGGQPKLAQGGHEASYQFLTDTTAPTATTAVSRPADGNGVYAHSVDVSFGGTDLNGVRGQEVRVQGPSDSAPGPWQQYVGLAPNLTVSATGTTYVQVRSLDDNGNLSASSTRAVTVDPSQFGTVGGTITGPGGPLSGIQVTLHAAASPGALRTTTTAADGTYAFTEVLRTASVKVLADDLTGVHVDEWYDGASTHGAATAVQAPVTANLALALTPGTVAGTVTGPSGGLSGITVQLHATGAEGVVASTTTGTGGTYTLDVVPGSYKVRFSDPSGDHLTEWFDDAGTHAAADAVAVTRSTTTTADAALTLTPGAVGGTVSDVDGPVSGIGVELHLAGAAGAVGTTTTDVDGHYAFPLVTPGTYKVHFTDASNVHVGEWHADAASHATATAVTVTKTQTSTVDATLALTPGSIQGTVSGSDGPLQDITVTVTPGGATTTTAADGSYEVAGLAPGAYTVAASPSTCWLGAEEDADVPTAGGADTVDLSLGEAPPGPHGLEDVPPWVDDAVRFMVDDCNDPPYMDGYADHTFRPSLPITRGAVIRALWRLAGQPTASVVNGFTDTPDWVDGAVSWAVEHDYMTGYPGNTFRPLADITRAEAARLFFRIEGSPPQTPHGHGLSDVPPWVDDAVTWLVSQGHAAGYPDHTFRPTLPITRAQFAAIASSISS